jgi:hypothetical protein
MAGRTKKAQRSDKTEVDILIVDGWTLRSAFPCPGMTIALDSFRHELRVLAVDKGVFEILAEYDVAGL